MSNYSAARTNLTSKSVTFTTKSLERGPFGCSSREPALEGTGINKKPACKIFKPQWRSMELEYYASDFRIADTAITHAESWNNFCCGDEIILVTEGSILPSGGKRYLCEPLIRNFKKFTSYSGWIKDSRFWTTEVMEAISHYTYHDSGGGQHLVYEHRLLLLLKNFETCTLSFIVSFDLPNIASFTETKISLKILYYCLRISLFLNRIHYPEPHRIPLIDGREIRRG